ncbi:bifunctional precorrin-2 dehydrogenase/sirohydrochlorin ferrochelatase [Flavobacterium chuncheonense]|uniref:precorrin-2 dehydrogenase n=1 Tax=Flavobacterium chuncheonense TaxID=2026653 RepID=A0ABW5YLJ0_9FLAO
MINTLFPVFLKTEAAHFLIVGGGNVGLEKAETLLKQNPEIKITIVATYFHQKLMEIGNAHTNITLLERAFQETDLDDKDFTIIATDKSDVNLEVRLLAKSKGIKVNVADQPALCDFYLGSIVNKGSLKIAISTNGKSPVLARRLREYFTEVIPDDIEGSIEVLNAFRSKHKGDFKEKLADLNEVTKSFQRNGINKEQKKFRKLPFMLATSFLMFFIGYGFSTIVSFSGIQYGFKVISNDFYYMLLIGFFSN